MKARAFIAYSSGLARAGSCSASTTYQPVYLFLSMRRNTGSNLTPVSRHGKHALLHATEEAEAVALHLLRHVHARVLEVDVAHPPDVSPQNALRILSREDRWPMS